MDTAEPKSAVQTPVKLSQRQLQVVRCISQGLSNKEIAAEMNLTYGSVKEYVWKIMKKTKCANRTVLALWFVRSGL